MEGWGGVGWREGAKTNTALCLLIFFLKTSHNLKLLFGASLGLPSLYPVFRLGLISILTDDEQDSIAEYILSMIEVVDM